MFFGVFFCRHTLNPTDAPTSRASSPWLYRHTVPLLRLAHRFSSFTARVSPWLFSETPAVWLHDSSLRILVCLRVARDSRETWGGWGEYDANDLLCVSPFSRLCSVPYRPFHEIHTPSAVGKIIFCFSRSPTPLRGDIGIETCLQLPSVLHAHVCHEPVPSVLGVPRGCVNLINNLPVGCKLFEGIHHILRLRLELRMPSTPVLVLAEDENPGTLSPP